MSRNEELSWNKLIRVLTHEIMNTVTPIASLSHTLSMDLTSSESGIIDKEELKMGLDTISESARGLIKFVDTYRSLTRVSAPVKKAYEDQISQIFINLVKNALQAKASKIEITAEIDFTESVVINVSNNGTPINKENYEDIFVPFYTTKQEGTGVGLSLSRQIMRLHNGSISLVCSNEKNTVFKLQFK